MRERKTCPQKKVKIIKLPGKARRVEFPVHREITVCRGRMTVGLPERGLRRHARPLTPYGAANKAGKPPRATPVKASRRMQLATRRFAFAHCSPGCSRPREAGELNRCNDDLCACIQIKGGQPGSDADGVVPSIVSWSVRLYNGSRGSRCAHHVQVRTYTSNIDVYVRT